MISLSKWWREKKCEKDWHDYHDATGEYGNYAMHFFIYTCRHCNKQFEI